MRKLCLVVLAASLAAPLLVAQEAAPISPISVVPHFMRYSGTMPDAPASASVVQVKFSLYGAQTGGEALWSETQQVALDPASKYAVVLGSSSAAGLPSELFAKGQARWIGVALEGREEAPRSLLVSAPYSLKASDAETLGGHPATDFALIGKDTNSNTLANITQISGSNGVLVNNVASSSATGPTVGLSLDGTYLGTLGAKYFAQLAVANTFAASQKISGNLGVSGTLTTLAGANKIAAGAAVDIAYANGIYTISLDGNQGEAFGNGLWAQLAHANTFTALNTFNGGLAASSTTAAIVGTTTDTTLGDYGVEGVAPNGSNGTGVYGLNGTPSSIGGSAIGLLAGSGGVWGDAGSTTGGLPVGVVGTSDDTTAAAFVGNGPDYYTFYIANYDSGGYLLLAVNLSTDANCTIDPSANLTCSGTVGTEVAAADGKMKKAFGVQSPEEWIEDFGSGQLSHGATAIQLEPNFASIVNTGVEYHVFVTPEGDSEHLYVANKGAGGFEVREAKGGTSDVAFSYRIVAKRKGHESTRLTEVPKGPTGKERGRSITATPTGLAKEAAARSIAAR